MATAKGREVALSLVVVAACAAMTGCAATSSTSAATPSSVAAGYCTTVRADKPQRDMSFEARAHLLRAAYSLAPPELKADFAQVLLAYEEIEDGEDGTIPESHVTRIREPVVTAAQVAIADYTLRQCGVDIGTLQAESP